MGSIYPAHAGINRDSCTRIRRWRDLPRTRGDKPGRRLANVRVSHIYPAHAGINRTRTATSSTALNLPRTRGDKPNRIDHIRQHQGSTPHTRG